MALTIALLKAFCVFFNVYRINVVTLVRKVYNLVVFAVAHLGKKYEF